MERQRKQYILLVEDSAVDYEIVTRALGKVGLHRPVHHCHNGDEALDFLAHCHTLPSLVLLDLNMPGTDGREVLRIIKEDARTKQMPTIILSTSNHDKDIETCYARGANSYVQKPLAPSEYVKMATVLKDFWFDLASLPDFAW